MAVHRRCGSAGGSPVSVSRDATEGEDPKAEKTNIVLAPGTKQELIEGGRFSVSGAIRRMLEDWRAFFGLPAPARAVLAADMAELGVATQRDYIVWLLIERHRTLRQRQSLEVPPPEAA